MGAEPPTATLRWQSVDRTASDGSRVAVGHGATDESPVEGRALTTLATARPEELLGSLTDLERRSAPRELFLRGNRTLLELGARVAVVGSRRASPQGLEWARLVTEVLVDHDITVVSGLATGIDTLAHRTALDRGGRTVAVLGTALDQYAVASNRGLQDEIGERGLLVSQFPAGSTPSRSNFPRRNKTMALLADATLIVEAGENSGTRHMGWEAIKLGRPVLFLQKFLDRTTAQWPREMVKYGAFPFDATSLPRVLDDLPYRTAETDADGEWLPF